MCDTRLAKVKCKTCNAVLCLKHVQDHKDQIPDFTHTIASLEVLACALAGKGDSAVRSPIPESEPRSGSLEVGAKVVEAELREVSAVPADRARVDGRIAFPAESQAELQVCKLYSSRVDIAQNFRLHKWMINASEAEALIQTIGAAGRPLTVIGVYGPVDISMKFIRATIRLSEEFLPLPEEPKEGIVAYLRRDTHTLCFYFKIERDCTYSDQPYPSSSREAVYLRLLFDLCPVVVCCISEEIQRNWYWTTDSQLKNPFLPKIHKGMEVKVNKRRIESSEIQEIPVEFPRSMESDFALTSDHWPFLFKTKLTVKDFSKQATGAIEKLKVWLTTRKPSTSREYNTYGTYGSYTGYSSYGGSSGGYSSYGGYSGYSGYNSYVNWDSLSSSIEFDTGSFHAFTNALRALSSEITVVVNTVKQKYGALKQAIQTEAADCFNAFYSELESKFTLKEKKWYHFGILTIPEEFRAKLRENFVEKRDYRYLDKKSKEIKELIVGLKDNADADKRIVTAAITTFFNEQLMSVTTRLQSAVDKEFLALENELIEVIEQMASHNTEEYSIRTLSLKVCDNSLTVLEKDIESRFTLHGHPSSVVLHVLDHQAAFAIASRINQVVKYNPSAGVTFEIEELRGIQSSVLLASGSTVSLFAAFYNDERTAIYGAAQEMKYINKGIPLTIYGEEVHQVRAACLLQKTRRLLILNETGNVYFIELVSSAKRLSPVLVDYSEERVSEEGLPLESLIVRRPLAPTTGSGFYDVKSSVDETLFFLLAECAIEIYDINYTLSKTIAVNGQLASFKVLASESYNILLIQAGNELKAYRFQSEMERVESTVEETTREIIPGNPIIDILYHAFSKFGCKNPITEDKSQFYIYSDVLKSECESYIDSISLLSQALRFRGTLTAGDLNGACPFESRAFELEVEDVKWRLLTRAPIHLCSIQDGNLIPLQDGLNNFEEFIGQIGELGTDFITPFVSYIKLGGLETIIRDSRNVKVVAIIGRQSSGKSYLLNRIFGTRFDVAAHRCTDGIWLSLSRIQGQIFLVLDCEGLFSVERSVQEEIKLCLLLAAIADITILNQDLTFNRNLSFLFEKFTFGIDRLKGSKLFKGCLEIAIRDVAANQDEGANAEVRKFVDKMIDSKKADFLIKLFGGVFRCCSYHNFENEHLFEAAVVSRRQYYMKSSSVRWSSGEEFLLILKTVMAQIFADDATSIDSRTFQLKLGKISTALKKAIEVPAAAGELISPANPCVSLSFSISGNSYSLELGLFDLKLNLQLKYLVFDAFMEKYVPKDLRTYLHNEWYEVLESLMKTYFEVYKSTLFGYFASAVAVTEDFRPFFDGELNILEKMFDNVLLLNHTLCRRKCRACDFCCLKPQNHSENCDCSTSHRCPYSCSLCGELELCSQSAGHTGSHLCNSKPHTCGMTCGLRRCQGTCTAAPNHGDIHRCSAATHPCGFECSAFHICKRTCEIDQVVPHTLHNCGQRSCPFPCRLCRGEFTSPCMSQDHLHYLSTDPGELSLTEPREVLHFCSKEHPCTARCQAKGICDLDSVTEVRVWSNEFNTFNYPYVSQIATKLKCSHLIPVKSTNHEGEHICGKEQHKCTATCPDCGAYCEQGFGHEDVHSTSAHRNKEKCIYVAKNEGIIFDIEEESKTTTRRLKAGESAKPEFCDQCCVRKGRGHIHPVECKGGTNCLQVACAGRAIHSDDRYYPDLSRVYDLLECETYWKLKGWEPPVFKKSPAAQSLFAFCPYYCASTEHSETFYCEQKLFHTNSTAYKDHQFSSCSHKSLSELDIAFVMDCTGSMSSAFPQVKDVITRVITKFENSEISCKFAIAGYTDHAPHNGAFPGGCPVDVHPPSKRLEDFKLQEAQAYLNRLTADGGGGNGGEAMLDGMNLCNSLGWRAKASRLVFIIGDENPHGREFSPSSVYPGGCPCKLNWRALLSIMKTAHTQIRFVKLSSTMNLTGRLFSEEYKGDFAEITLNAMTDISIEVEKSIVATIEHNLEFALE